MTEFCSHVQTSTVLQVEFELPADAEWMSTVSATRVDAEIFKNEMVVISLSQAKLICPVELRNVLKIEEADSDKKGIADKIHKSVVGLMKKGIGLQKTESGFVAMFSDSGFGVYR